MSAWTFTLLGCGNSAGTPSIGNHWGACDPNEPRNRRSRAAAVVQSAKTTLLVDAGPDLREQANREGIADADAVLFTHAHSDHIAGVEELRVFRVRHKKLVPIYGDRTTMDDLRTRYDYLFMERNEIYPEVLTPNIIREDQMNAEMTVGDITFIPFVQDHGTCQSLGYRFRDLAYSTDMVDLDQQALETLSGVKIWIVDGAAYHMAYNLVHANLKKVYELNEIVQASQVYITHLPSFMDYQTLKRELPKGYEPAWDGLKITL
ncbi:MAG: MBL fold metallo-hydrolase [Micavibrio aeruginosavorus]|nr:MBL fold metallo-hydrolase [Micavibrio aeruginosavorus]